MNRPSDQQKQELREEAERLHAHAPTPESEQRLKEIAFLLGDSPGDEEQAVAAAAARTITSD